MSREESAFELLIGAYLNEDIFDYYPDVLAGVDDFCRHEPDLLDELVGEIADALDTTTDAELDELLRELGIGFVAGARTYRAWLQQIADRVRAKTGPADR